MKCGCFSCWLSLEDGLLWAFVGPALATLLVSPFVLPAFVSPRMLASLLLHHLLQRLSLFVTRTKKQLPCQVEVIVDETGLGCCAPFYACDCNRVLLTPLICCF